MYNLNDLIEQEIENGYGDSNAQAKVCQDIVLKAIATSSLKQNVTIKGGVVLRSKTKNVRRATQDLDIDFIRYSLSDESIEKFIEQLNCLEGITIVRCGAIEELKQQDYHGKRVYIIISDDFNNEIRSKLDLGVHNHLDIEQEEYCFDISFDDEGASLLVNSYEQMLSEKLRSLLRFGPVSTRYGDVFDIYYLSQNVDKSKLRVCMNSYIYSDSNMREKNIQGVLRRVKLAFKNKMYRSRLLTADKKWLDEDIDKIFVGIVEFLESLV